MKVNYTIEQLAKPEDFTKDVINFLQTEVSTISKMFDDKFNYENCYYQRFATKGIFLICRRNGIVRGYMIASLERSHFDYNTILLQQISFYVKPNSGRTAYHLFQKFIDIGKRQANHVITMLTSQTNIKPETLFKMGFKEMETLYRLEV